MRYAKFLLSIVLILFCFFTNSQCLAVTIIPDLSELGIVAEVYGGINILGNAPDYEWWYGCSPTAAGMMMGYYDLNGYQGLSYDNLIPGGQAELSSFGHPGALANQAIASPEHIADFWKGYGQSGDPLASGRTRPDDFNCLADFMGTSQDDVGNTDGSTIFFLYNDGRKLTAEKEFDLGIAQFSGLYGIGEYLQYCGYNYVPGSLYIQYTDNLGLPYGFSFQDYKNEIDSGRVVMINVEGHSMFGYGYDDATQTVYLHDTWWEGQDSMIWGGSYYGLPMIGVVCFTPTGGSPQNSPVPLPPAIFLFASGLLGLVGLGRKGLKS